MSPSAPQDPDPGGSFRLGAWLVEPTLNRMSRADTTVHLEPRLMDVLAFLSRHAGRVVSKDDLIAGVWKMEFISEWAVTRAIAKLRRALGDDARHPRIIETISKRGYRLVATVSAPHDGAHPAGENAAPIEPVTVASGGLFAPGQWVRGARFHGRTDLIAEVLHGPRDSLWILGTRAMGKTSVLRQLEHVAGHSTAPSYFPLFWDLQGAENAGDLAAQFRDALLEAEPRLAGLGVTVAEIEDGDVFTCLARTRRRLAGVGVRLLLLCDEVEELVRLQQVTPALTRKLRRGLHSAEGVRTVLAASGRLWALSEVPQDTSPFLHGFTPPLYLGPLSDGEARALLRGEGCTGTPAFDDATVAELCRRSGNHPYLLQLLGRRMLELGDLQEAERQVAADPSLDHLLTVDFDLLSPLEREVVAALATGASPIAADTCGAALHNLERLGVVRTGPAARVVLRNPFFERWLRREARR